MVPPGLSATTGVLEELRAKPREAEIVLRSERITLHVSLDKAHVLDAPRSGVVGFGLQERVTAVQPEDGSSGAHDLRQLDGRITEAAAKIDHLVTGLHLQRRKHLAAVVCQAVDKDLLEADKLGHEDFIPKIDEFVLR